MAMHTDPAQTQNRDSITVGHRERSHNTASVELLTATATATTWLTVPLGPVGLQIKMREMALIPRMTSATRRHVVF